MGAINQYIDLFVNNRQVIEAHSPHMLNALRQEALNALDGHRLPQRGEEGYEKTSIEDMFAPDFGLNINRMNIPVNVAASFRCDIPNVSTWLSFIVNDMFYAPDNSRKNMPEGVIVDSLSRVAGLQPDLLSRYYGKIATLDDAAVALNTLLVQDGVVIYIPRGVKLEKPLQLVNIFSSPVDLMAVRRLLIVVEDNAEG